MAYSIEFGDGLKVNNNEVPIAHIDHIQGGVRVVPTLADAGVNNYPNQYIPGAGIRTAHRTEGMIIKTADSGYYYMYTGADIAGYSDAANWTRLGGSNISDPDNVVGTGASAYDIWVDNGGTYNGGTSESDFLQAIRGSQWYGADTVPNFYFSAGNPGQNITLRVNDLFIDTSTGNVHRYNGTNWTNLGISVKGVDGAPGPQGAQGIPGAPGTGFSNVQYDSATGNINFTSTDGTLDNSFGPITGSDGEQGPQGPAGPQGIQGLQGLPGAAGIDGKYIAQVAFEDNNLVFYFNDNTVAGTIVDAVNTLKGEQGIQGEVGSQGAQGIQGIQGEQGLQGEIGTTGASAEIQGTAEIATIVSITTASPGHMYISSNTGTAGSPSIFANAGDGIVWNGTSWSNVGSIRGPQGIQGEVGAQGVQGIQGIQGPSGSAVSESFFQGDDIIFTLSASMGFVTLSDAKAILKGETGPQGIQGIQGTQGIQGPQGVQGEQGLQGERGYTGDSGVDGTSGADGSTWYSADSEPAGDIGTSGDFYLHTSTYIVSRKIGTAWTEVANLTPQQGEQGDSGADGADGLPGIDGSHVTAAAFSGDNINFTLSGNETITLANAVTTLKGDTGTSIQDIQISEVGDVDITLSDSNHIFPGNLKGTDGEAGATIATAVFDGTAILFTLTNAVQVRLEDATSILAGPTGLFINSATFQDDDIVFTLSDNSSTVSLEGAKTALTGPQGERGVKGDAGSGVTIRDTLTAQDIAAIDTTNVSLATMYILSADGNAGEGIVGLAGDGIVWLGSAWTNVGPIRGIQGEQGPQGIQGEVGAQGDQGIQGEQGLQGTDGDTGADGQDGEDGAPGAKGDQGDQGIQGAQGPTGPAGADGIDGTLDQFSGAAIITGSLYVSGSTGFISASTINTHRITGPSGTSVLDVQGDISSSGYIQASELRGTGSGVGQLEVLGPIYATEYYKNGELFTGGDGSGAGFPFTGSAGLLGTLNITTQSDNLTTIGADDVEFSNTTLFSITANSKYAGISNNQIPYFTQLPSELFTFKGGLPRLGINTPEPSFALHISNSTGNPAAIALDASSAGLPQNRLSITALSASSHIKSNVIAISASNVTLGGTEKSGIASHLVLGDTELRDSVYVSGSLHLTDNATFNISSNASAVITTTSPVLTISPGAVNLSTGQVRINSSLYVAEFSTFSKNVLTPGVSLTGTPQGVINTLYQQNGELYWSGVKVVTREIGNLVPAQTIASSGSMHLFTTSPTSEFIITTPVTYMNTTINSYKSNIPYNTFISPPIYNSAAAIASQPTAELRGGEVAVLTPGAEVVSTQLRNANLMLTTELTSEATDNIIELISTPAMLTAGGPRVLVQGDILKISNEWMQIITISSYTSNNDITEYTIVVDRASLDPTTNTPSFIDSHEPSAASANSIINSQPGSVKYIHNTVQASADQAFYIFERFSSTWQKLHVSSSGFITPT